MIGIDIFLTSKKYTVFYKFFQKHSLFFTRLLANAKKIHFFIYFWLNQQFNNGRYRNTAKQYVPKYCYTVPFKNTVLFKYCVLVKRYVLNTVLYCTGIFPQIPIPYCTENFSIIPTPSEQSRYRQFVQNCLVKLVPTHSARSYQVPSGNCPGKRKSGCSAKQDKILI